MPSYERDTGDGPKHKNSFPCVGTFICLKKRTIWNIGSLIVSLQARYTACETSV
jgi:hypothetical protein